MVHRGATVTWDNQTSDAHWPWPIDRHGNLLTEEQAKAYGFYLGDEIPRGSVSNPFNVDPIFSAPVPPGQRQPPPGVPPPPQPDIPPDTINYVCKNHLNDGDPIIVGGRIFPRPSWWRRLVSQFSASGSAGGAGRGGQIIVQEG
jgi:hypothetical protein